MKMIPQEIKIINLTQKADNRGYLIELFRKEAMDIEGDVFGQVYIAMTNPGIVRGNHYHSRKVEWFAAIGGEPLLILENITTKVQHEFYLVEKAIRIPPNFAHAFINTGNEPSLLIAYISESFNPDDPDTFSYTVK
jgi:dTDP-4-dehydrorhamnose 3,5-epimerase-like enzyme